MAPLPTLRPGKANPLATILSAGMMLKYSLDQPEAAQAIEDAVSAALKQARTPDIAAEGLRTVNCTEMGDLVSAFFERDHRKSWSD